ncbi:lipase secretion chaperone [Alcanivorax marinus]|uniref:Lipase chaperone n=2 Tax=Alloalcanivorax marinus TaxID=1177169 RepID=A0A9Q3UN18_9GAMM|nr:lipase secretion chaperone [Alloalcanivorax marinus]MCC4309430.1 lipase secretion chaperone [Alloalcanivorax marinus]
MRVWIPSLLIILVLAALAWVLVPFPGDAGAPSVTPTSVPKTPVRAQQGGDDFETYAARGSKLEAAPASWRGTVPDGELRADANGDLVVSEGVRWRFDYFLSALGEEDLNVLRARVAAHLDEVLPPRAARQAWALFEQYVGYRAALRGLEEPGREPAALRRSLEERQALRAQWFDATAREAFFGFRDRYDRFALARRDILDDESLNAEQKAARLAELEASLPEDLRAMVTASRQPVRLAADVAALRERGVSEARIYQLREQELGAEAADRLAALDRRRQEWDRRYQAYREQRAAILDSGLAPADRDAQVEALRERLFEERERRRVEALDRMASP